MAPKKQALKASTQKVGQYTLNSKFLGYHAREDPTTLPAGTLVSPSQNVVIKTTGRVALVPGYVLDGGGSTIVDSGILSNFDFTNYKGDLRNLRAGFLSTGFDGRLQYRYIDALGDVNWVDLVTGMTNVRLSYCTFTDTTNLVKDVLWVNGSNNIFAWNGAVTTFASASNSTGYITALSTTPTNGGSGYVVGDVLTITGGSATATVVSVSGSTSQAVIGFSITNGGHGYTVGDTLTFTVTTEATWQVTSVDTNGMILSLKLVSGGSGFSETYYTLVGGSGSGMFISVNALGGQTITGLALTATGSGYSSGTGTATTGGSGTGATVDISSVGNYAVTKQGTTTWAQEGFLQTNGSVTIGSAVYTYAFAIGEMLVGLNQDPTTPVFSVSTIMHQTPVTTPLASMASVPATFSPTVIGCGRQNQVYLGSSTATQLYISKVNNYTDYSFTTPTRVVGEGFSLPIDAAPTGFISSEDRNSTIGGIAVEDMYFSMGLGHWGVIRDILSADLTTETIEYVRLMVSPQQGAFSARLMGKMKNHIMFVSNDQVAQFFGIESYENVPEAIDFSYTIVDDMKSYDFTDGQIYYLENYIYLTVPKSGLIRIFNMTNQTKQTTQSPSYFKTEDVDENQPWFWEAPVTYPISGFYWTPDKGLCGHSYVTSESYQLFTGGSFNGQEIDAGAYFAPEDKTDRTASKGSDEIWVEGYIQQNTELTVTVTGDLDAAATSQTTTIDGSDSSIVAYGNGAHALGKNNLGSQPLGGAQLNTATRPAWFHVAKTYPESPYYLESVSFITKGVDLAWEIICFGTNAAFTSEGNNNITQ